MDMPTSDPQSWNGPTLWRFLRPFVLCALATTLYITISSVGLLLLVVGAPRAWPVYLWQIVLLLYLIPALILAVGFLSYLMRRRYMSPAAAYPASTSWQVLSVSRVVQAGVFLVLISTALPLQYLYTHPLSSQPSTWTAQLATARAAAQVDADAVLESVSADTVAFHPRHIDANTTFKVDFVFRRPSGESSWVELVDTDPPRVVDVRPKWDYTDTALDEAYRHTLTERLAAIQLSPRDVYRQTLANESDLSQGKEVIYPSIFLTLQADWQPRWGIPTGWTIVYVTTHENVMLRVHPGTGEIVGGENEHH